MEKPAPLKAIKDELAGKSSKELISLISILLRFKKENKELITYLLFYSKDEQEYIRSVKHQIDDEMETINRFKVKNSMKTIRKALRHTKKAIRMSGKPETEVELLLHFLSLLKNKELPYYRFRSLTLIYERLIVSIKKALNNLHEDLKHDYSEELDKLLE